MHSRRKKCGCQIGVGMGTMYFSDKKRTVQEASIRLDTPEQPEIGLGKPQAFEGNSVLPREKPKRSVSPRCRKILEALRNNRSLCAE